MIQTAQVTGARALQALHTIRQYVQSHDTKYWTAEEMGSLDASSLGSLLDDIDHRAAQELSSQLMLELSDLFCLIRDRAYANRSRRWLYTKAYKTKILSAYELWAAFVKENRSQDLKKNFLDVDPLALVNIDFATALTLPENSTKLTEALANLNKS
jgi:hypothetical protein